MEEISYNEIAIILNLLKSKRGFDFTGNKRVFNVGCGTGNLERSILSDPVSVNPPAR